MVSRDLTHLTGGLAEATMPEPSTAPDSGGRPIRRQSPAGRAVAFFRNIWRGLTSMRTALVLLFLLALASLPGALLPQWSLNTSKTAQYIIDHGSFGTWLNRLGFFEVFASPWYAAIYLLLFTSLIGCLLPRTWDFVGQIRMQPVATPRNLSRMPHSATRTAPGTPSEVADRIEAGLRGWRKVRRAETGASVTISAEKGFLREVGNLIFHFSLLGLLIAIAVGKLLGFEGSVIVNADDGANSELCSVSPISYDNFRPGLLVDGTDMAPFCVDIDKFTATYTDTGQASSFVAKIRYQTGAGIDSGGEGGWLSRDLEVNDPLRLSGQRLYLLGHGYSPVFDVTYPSGEVQTRSAPFQPEDQNFTSQGAVKITDPPGYQGKDLQRHQLAIVGIFAPSATVHAGIMTSNFPAPQTPGVAIQIYRGDLGMETGVPQSVFSIDSKQVANGTLVKLNRANLAPGESMKLDDGTTIRFTGFKEWVSLQTSYDPAQGWALIFAVSLLVGLMISLTIKRRRVWYRIGGELPAGAVAPVTPAGGVDGDGLSGSGRTVGSGGPAADLQGSASESGPVAVSVQIGGLARTDQAGYGDEFTRLTALTGAGS